MSKNSVPIDIILSENDNRILCRNMSVVKQNIDMNVKIQTSLQTRVNEEKKK